jgi:dTDP-4-dehydrorhamnose reductase
VSKILVMGSTGMLGSSIKSELLTRGSDIFWTRRSQSSQTDTREYLLDVRNDDLKTWFRDKPKFDYVINCVGAIPQKYVQGSESHIREMIELNTLLPKNLNELSDTHGFRTIQIATDCVFEGTSSKYSEDSLHDALDLYGVTKSLGEKYSSDTMLLRSSIIGKNDATNSSLHNWLLAQGRDASVNGYKNHFWNGITTLAFARIVSGIIEKTLFTVGVQHILPSDEVTKYHLLEIIAEVNGRLDLHIMPVDHEMTIDRTLTSLYLERNELLWASAGYENVPSISELVREMDS